MKKYPIPFLCLIPYHKHTWPYHDLWKTNTHSVFHKNISSIQIKENECTEGHTHSTAIFTFLSSLPINVTAFDRYFVCEKLSTPIADLFHPSDQTKLIGYQLGGWPSSVAVEITLTNWRSFLCNRHQPSTLLHVSKEDTWHYTLNILNYILYDYTLIEVLGKQTYTHIEMCVSLANHNIIFHLLFIVHNTLHTYIKRSIF